MPHCWLALVALVGISACAPLPATTPATSPTASATPTASASPTPTPIWFPPTRTPTPFPTPQATPTQPDLRPGVAGQLFADTFAAAGEWQLRSLPGGSVALGVNALTIAISQPKTYLSSLRSAPALTDFYLEITASPVLCRGLDEYGLLVRAASDADYYRFSLSCDGQTRLDRLVGGAASSAFAWQVSGAFPAGAPNRVRLAVWASGPEMRFFINEVHQFSVRDARFSSGLVGVFARSADNDALTVAFSALTVWEVAE